MLCLQQEKGGLYADFDNYGFEKNMGHILDTISKNNELVIISRANKPLAVIISIAEYEEKVKGMNVAALIDTSRH